MRQSDRQNTRKPRLGTEFVEQSETPLDAGRFSIWLGGIRKALRNNQVVRVPCGSCDACCRSSRFVHIGPSEKRSLKLIPPELLFPAPLAPDGTVVLDFHRNGRCPMLAKSECSIYSSRPLACRTFDCRVLTATGLATDFKEDNPVVRQARRWRFTFSTDRDRGQFSSIRKTARFLKHQSALFPPNLIPKDEILLSALAIKVYDVFIRKPQRKPSTSLTVRAVLDSFEKFERGSSPPRTG